MENVEIGGDYYGLEFYLHFYYGFSRGNILPLPWYLVVVSCTLKSFGSVLWMMISFLGVVEVDAFGLEIFGHRLRAEGSS